MSLLPFMRSYTFMLLLLLLSLFHLTVAHFTSSVQPLCHNDERSALWQFKESLIIDQYASREPTAYPKVASWVLEGENSDCCSWDGVKCNEDTGHVISLDLTSSCLHGPINSSSNLFQLMHLERLSLSDNHFEGSSIPTGIINFSRLSHLDLSSAVFSGQIPAEVLQLSKLETLDLSSNDLVLQNPDLTNLVEKLTNLKILGLNMVNISSLVPDILADLSSLTYLSLSGCSLLGQFPAMIFHLPNLFYLDVMYNPSLTGYLPEFKKSSPLSYLNIGGCKFSGTIPFSLGNLTGLVYLDLSNNEFFGEFPTGIFQLPNLHRVNVASTSSVLTGSLPGFSKNSSLEGLILSGNKFFGEIPDSIGNLKSLSQLNIESCHFTGIIPSSLGNLTKLILLNLAFNQFSGDFPIFIGNLGSLRSLDINNCDFSGPVASSIGNLTQLDYLDLSYNNFSSQNSYALSWIADLSKLTHLRLSGINILGEIPSWLMNVTQLRYLFMGYNQLTGPFPYWLMGLNRLISLCLNFNQLAGYIPSQIRNLTQLNVLDISFNQLQGPIPSSMFELENLEYLDLCSNNLSGILELELFLVKFESLQVLVLSSNNFSLLTETSVDAYPQEFWEIGFSSCNLTKFPSFLQSQDTLLTLDLSSNKISGQIPVWLLNLSTYTLEYLNLSNNFLTGFDRKVATLPWSSLVTLNLAFNKLQGPLPVPSLFTYSYLVSNNMFTGELPPWICNLNNLYALDLSNNNLNGVLPQCLGNFSSELAILKLHGNRFHGSIPLTFIDGTNLRMLDLSDNLLKGRIPRSLANCTRLEFLDLGNNQINDIFPSWLGTLPQLSVLILRFNWFHGIIKEPETEFDQFPKLRIIDLSFNRFTGNIPSNYFQCWNAMKVVNASHLIYMQNELTPPFHFVFSYYGSYDYSLSLSNKGMEMKYGKISNMLTGIILSNNKFVGEIPISIGNLKGLNCLDLSNNNLVGLIPSSLINLTVLESLDLSNNKLSGRIPQQLVELTSLEFFNVSHNNLSGSIPQGNQLNTFENSSFDGNPELCGKPLSRQCENSEVPQEEGQEIEDSGSLFAFDWKIVLTGYAGGLIAGVVLAHTFSAEIYGSFAKFFGMRLKRMKSKRGI